MNIKIIYSKRHREHNPPYEIYDGLLEPYAEKAERIESVAETLRTGGLGRFYNPSIFPISHINNVHQKQYVSFLQKRSNKLRQDEVLYPSYFIIDTYTPIVRKTYMAAKTAVDVALTGARYVLRGEKVVYSLCRPPGHHAEYKTMGGYCYFNNAAIAADYLSRKGRAVILDIDFHHGNGTQSIFYNRSDVLYISIHADPHEKFPYISGFANERGSGEGLGFNKNYPLPLGITDKQYFLTLRKALKDINDFNPKFLIVSAGFDTYEKDPIGGFKLTIPFYETIGREIASLQIPTLIIQEGGYHIEDLGKIALSFLRGIGSNLQPALKKKRK
ncbi:histone deacetylase family protein [Patescibacteria group bacterium]|nr:histone deacetylase family protein [Patescibacteria group bacterium]MCL5010305.1 histone deacetylase family protein [Patescibacteria group bacterium]